MNDDKTEDVIIKRFKYANDSTKEPWRLKIKLGSKPGDKNDIAYRKQPSTGNLKKLEEIFKRQGKVSTEKRVKLYNTLLRNALLYNSSTWGLSMNDEKALYCFNKKQLRKIVGV